MAIGAAGANSDSEAVNAVRVRLADLLCTFKGPKVGLSGS